MVDLHIKIKPGHTIFDAIFTWVDQETGDRLHFNTSYINRELPKWEPLKLWWTDLDQYGHDYMVNNRGIEEEHLATLTPERLREPCLAVVLNPYKDCPGGPMFIDGHHRAVQNFRNGVRKVEYKIVPYDLLIASLVELPKEMDDFIAERTVIEQKSYQQQEKSNA